MIVSEQKLCATIAVLFLVCTAITASSAQAEQARKMPAVCRMTTGEIVALEKQAAKGETGASIQWAEILLAGLCIPRDEIKARLVLEQASASGSLAAFHRLAATYSGWGGLPADDGKARALYQQAADKAYAPAQHDVAGFYLNGTNGFPKDSGEAIRWYEKAANNGYSNSARDLANIYRLGIGVKPDSEKAEQWARHNAASGDPMALYELGAALAGKGDTDSRLEALRVLEQAAQKGMYPAGGIVAALLTNGNTKAPTQQDFQQAYQWYRVAETGGLILTEKMLDAKSHLTDTEVAAAETKAEVFMRTYPPLPPVE